MPPANVRLPAVSAWSARAKGVPTPLRSARVPREILLSDLSRPVAQRHHDVVLLDGNLNHTCAEAGRVRLDVEVGPLWIDALHSDVQRHAARPILDVAKQHPAHRGTGCGGIRGHW